MMASIPPVLEAMTGLNLSDLISRAPKLSGKPAQQEATGPAPTPHPKPAPNPDTTNGQSINGEGELGPSLLTGTPFEREALHDWARDRTRHQ
jgi:hypothetical protein